MKIKNGWAMDRERFTKRARVVFEEAIMDRRIKVVLLGETLPNQRFGGIGGETLRGHRFKDNEAVFARVESYFTEAEFMAAPAHCVDAALLDAARSDYYYEFEKDYGHNRESAKTEIAIDTVEGE